VRVCRFLSRPSRPFARSVLHYSASSRRMEDVAGILEGWTRRARFRRSLVSPRSFSLSLSLSLFSLQPRGPVRSRRGSRRRERCSIIRVMQRDAKRITQSPCDRSELRRIAFHGSHGSPITYPAYVSAAAADLCPEFSSGVPRSRRLFGSRVRRVSRPMSTADGIENRKNGEGRGSLSAFLQRRCLRSRRLSRN